MDKESEDNRGYDDNDVENEGLYGYEYIPEDEYDIDENDSSYDAIAVLGVIILS